MKNKAAKAAFCLTVFAVASQCSSAVLTGVTDIKDIRVAPLVSSKWTVGEFGGDKAFNLYTPKNYSCGCGITAYAQVMRYWRAPVAPVESKTYKCWTEDVSQSVATIGGAYDWDAMPLLSEDCTNASQREALGHLTYDLGVASHVCWANAKYSYSYGVFSVMALSEYFGYKSARSLMSSVSYKNILNDDDYKNAILASLDAGMPVVVGLRASNGQGHQAVVDGYGFGEDGNIYCHLNFGWNGAADLWYNLIATDFIAGDGIDEFQFFQIDEVAYNIHPNDSGDVISGRVLDSSGNPVPNVAIKLGNYKGSTIIDDAVTNEKGIYSLRFNGKGKYKVWADDSVHGRAEKIVNITKDGANIGLESGIDFNVPFTSFALYATSFGVVANRWGEDLVLKNEGSSSEPTPEPSPEPSSEPSSDPTTGPSFTAKAAATLDGYIMNGEKVAGTVSIKAGKANKVGESKLSATVILNSRKLSYKGIMGANGEASLTCSGQPAMTVTFGETTMSGRLGSYTVDGARNLFTSKNKAEVTEANDMLKPWLGVVNMTWDAGYISVNIAAKGKVKATGMVDGKKVSATGQVLLGEKERLIPIVIAKSASLAFMLRLPTDGSDVSVSGIDSAVVGKVGALGATARFTVDKDDDIWNKLPGKALVDQLPNGVAVSQSGVGAKWNVPKAGKVVYVKGSTEVDSSKTGDNPAGLKLAYKAKDGTFKGSFKVYSDTNGKLKATAVTVTGLQVGNKGYGVATIKKLGSVPVTIE